MMSPFSIFAAQKYLPCQQDIKAPQNRYTLISKELLSRFQMLRSLTVSHDQEFVVATVPRKSLAVMGHKGRFPVQQIYCVGRNYADHAVEMGHDPVREEPFFFMKPDYSILQDGEVMTYPGMSQDLQHEVELVVALGSGGQNIDVAQASACIYGYGVGIDMTRRDLQGQAKDQSRPWDAGKSFLHGAPCSALVTSLDAGNIDAGSISLAVNGEIRQSGDLAQMLWKVPEIISRLSMLFFLQPGDLIFTGTPKGVGPVHPGDTINARINGVGELSIRVAGSMLSTSPQR
jgi:fumarylpyruvate hydrolase